MFFYTNEWERLKITVSKGLECNSAQPKPKIIRSQNCIQPQVDFDQLTGCHTQRKIKAHKHQHWKLTTNYQSGVSEIGNLKGCFCSDNKTPLYSICQLFNPHTNLTKHWKLCVCVGRGEGDFMERIKEKQKANIKSNSSGL